MKTSYVNIPSLSRFGTLTAFVLAFVSILVAPISAIQWRSQPFPGFLVEQTLVVSTTTGSGWVGNLNGLSYPMRVTQLDGKDVHTSSDYLNFFKQASFGQQISVKVAFPDGSIRNFEDIELKHFPNRDFFRLFWLPYLIGLVYLFLGMWVYRLRGETGAGRAFAYFSTCAGMVSALIFAIWTSHVGTPVWTLAVAQLGGAIIGLSVLFPVAAGIARRVWVRGLAYGFSFLLAGWGLILIYDLERPWAYVLPWLYSYLYVALGIATFIMSMILRLRMPLPLLARQQVRMILWGAVIAFTPIGIWFALQAFINTPFNPLLLTPLLLIFPMSIAFSMLRYRLWEFDLVIRRTLIYTALTITLVVIYLLFVIGMDAIFDRFWGHNNSINVIATLLIVLIYTPFRRVVQRFVDHRWYNRYQQKEEIIQDFVIRLRTQVDLGQLSDDLIGVIERTMQPDEVLFWVPKTQRKIGGKDV